MELHDAQYLVTATLDDRREVRLLVDTGAAITVLRPALLRAMGYDLQGGEQQYFATAGGVVSAPIVDLQSLSLGTARIEQLPVAAMDLAGAGGIDGLLGMNFLGRYQFQIDQPGRRLQLTSRDAPH